MRFFNLPIIRMLRTGGCVGALKDMIVDGVVLPALLRAGRWKGADAVQGYTDIDGSYRTR